MKTCPVCKARCFDDMETCFGCLHDFSRGASGPLHAKPPVLESSLEVDPEPEEAVLPSRGGTGLAKAGAHAQPAGVSLAPDLSMGVPPGYRLVLRFEPLE